MHYYLAVDIGASGGRHMLGHIKGGKIVYEQMHRFKTQKGGWNWSSDVLVEGIIEGMIKCREAGKIPKSMGIDTFGVEFALLDRENKHLADSPQLRKELVMFDVVDKAHELDPFVPQYFRTGIQKMPVNTLYQLYSLKLSQPELLQKAGTFIMLPDLLNFALTGVIRHEYTFATTTQLLHARDKDWDYETIRNLGLPGEIFGEISQPGTFVGRLLPEIRRRVGFDCAVYQVASHDTASAYLAAPVPDENSVLVSSGTWSLIGAESLEPVISETSLKEGLSNEGNYASRYRVLKNLVGTYMLQRVKAELDDRYDFPQLAQLAREASGFPSTIDSTDFRLLTLESMIQGIKDLCAQSGQPVPETTGEVLQCIYRSIAQGYVRVTRGLERSMNKKFTSLSIFSGGCRDDYLNQLAAEVTGLPVYAGPVEAATIGNFLMQMLEDGTYSGLEEARAAVRDSFEIKRIDPR